MALTPSEQTAVNPSDVQARFREIPTEYSERYSESDKKDVAFILNWLNANEKTNGFLGTAAGVNKALVSRILRGSYPGIVETHLRKMVQTIRHMEERKPESDYTPFVDTHLSRLIATACRQTRITRMFGVVTANVGTGKTRALRNIAQEQHNTWLIESYPGMNSNCLIHTLIERMNISIPSGRGRYVNAAGRLELVINHVRMIDSGLIILDEAETVQARTLETLRRLSDLGGIGIVLTGTPALYQLIKPAGSQFDQIRSRATFFPEPVYQIKPDDARAVIAVSFEDRPEIFDDEGNLDEELFQAFWSLSAGSLRMLVDGLIPAMKRYGIPQYNEVSTKVLYGVAKKALNLTPKPKQ